MLAHLIDPGWLDAAEAATRWQRKHRNKLPLSVVARLCAVYGGNLEVVMALALGRVKRAHKMPDGSIRPLGYDYACVLEDVTIMDTKRSALVAAIAIWLALR